MSTAHPIVSFLCGAQKVHASWAQGEVSSRQLIVQD